MRRTPLVRRIPVGQQPSLVSTPRRIRRENDAQLGHSSGSITIPPQVDPKQVVQQYLLHQRLSEKEQGGRFSFEGKGVVNLMKWSHANEVYRELARQLIGKTHRHQRSDKDIGRGNEYGRNTSPVESFLQFSSWCTAMNEYGENIRFEDILSPDLGLPSALQEGLDPELCAAKGESSLSGWLQQFNNKPHPLSPADWRNISFPAFLSMIQSLDRYDTGVNVGAPFGEDMPLQPYHGVNLPQRFERASFRELYHWLAEWHGKADLTGAITTGQACGGYVAGLLLKTRVQEVETCDENEQALLNTEEFVDRLLSEGAVPRSGREIFVTKSKNLPDVAAGILREREETTDDTDRPTVSSKIGLRQQKRKNTVGKGRGWELNNQQQRLATSSGEDRAYGYKGAIFAVPVPSIVVVPGLGGESPVSAAQRDLLSRNEFLAQVSSPPFTTAPNSDPPLLNSEECFVAVLDHNLHQVLTLFAGLQMKMREMRGQNGSSAGDLSSRYTSEAETLVRQVKDFHRDGGKNGNTSGCSKEILQLLQRFDTQGNYSFQLVHSSADLVYQDSFLQHYDPMRLLVASSYAESDDDGDRKQVQQVFQSYMHALVSAEERGGAEQFSPSSSFTKGVGQRGLFSHHPPAEQVLEQLSQAFSTIGSMLHTRLQVIRRVPASKATRGTRGGVTIPGPDSKFGKWDLLGSRTGFEGGVAAPAGQFDDCNNSVFLTGGVDQRQLTNPQMHHHVDTKIHGVGGRGNQYPTKSLEYEDTEDFQHYLPPSRQSVTLEQAQASALGGVPKEDAIASGAGAGYGTDFSFLSEKYPKEEKSALEKEHSSSSAVGEQRMKAQAQENFDMLFYGEKKKLLLQGTRQTRQLRKMALRSHSSKEDFLERFVQKNLHADLVELKNGVDELERLTINKEEIRRRTQQEPNRQRAVEHSWLRRPRR